MLRRVWRIATKQRNYTSIDFMDNVTWIKWPKDLSVQGRWKELIPRERKDETGKNVDVLNHKGKIPEHVLITDGYISWPCFAAGHIFLNTPSWVYGAGCSGFNTRQPKQRSHKYRRTWRVTGQHSHSFWALEICDLDKYHLINCQMPKYTKMAVNELISSFDIFLSSCAVLKMY